MTAVLALDLGTTAVKAALIDAGGRHLASAAAVIATVRPGDGGAEQDPADWLAAARAAIAECLGRCAAQDRSHDGPRAGTHDGPLGGGPPAALALTGQMQDLVLLPAPHGDHDPRALRPAILYTDMRAADDARELHAALPDWERITGCTQDATSCAAMWQRLARLEPETIARTRAIVLGPAGFLAWALSCGVWCDPTTASTTGLLDAGGAWSPEVCRAAGLPIDLLPALTGSIGRRVGTTGESAARLLGLPAGIPVVLAPGDAAATTLGLVGLAPGADYASLGTSGWLARVVTDQAAEAAPSAAHRLALPDPATRLRICAVLAAGGAAAWAREAFLSGASPEEADALLEDREAAVGRRPTGLLAVPSILGERYPLRDGDLRAAVIGMDPSTRGIDLYAAVLEGVAHALTHDAGADAAATDADLPPLAVTGGGSASAPWLRILADVSGRPVLPLEHAAGASLHGCALAAADARGGGSRSLQPLAAGDSARAIAPDPAAVRAHAALHALHRDLYDLLPRLP